MREPRRTGFVDESYGRDPAGRLVYVLGLVEIRDGADDLRAALRELPRTRGGVLHFANEDDGRRVGLAKAVGQLGVELTAVVRRGGDSLSRARAIGLTTIAWSRQDGLDRLEIESRGPKPDRADARLMAALHPPARRIPVRFPGKAEDPLLWVADILASATFQALARAEPRYLEALGPVGRIDC